MALFYIILRTFPFWAIPLGFVMVTGYFPTRKAGRRYPIIWVILGIFLLAASVLFLVKKGHLTAVPLAHEIFNDMKDSKD